MNLSKAMVAVALAAAAATGISACSSTETRRSTGQYIDDASITTRVKAALVDTPNVSATDIHVDTHNGIVQLSGFVDSQDEARRAIASAQGVTGVRSVKNNMQMK